GCKDLSVLNGSSWARFLRHLVVEVERFNRQIKVCLEVCDDLQGCFALRPFKTVVTLIKVTNHLDHKRACNRAPAVPNRTSRRLVPVAPGPDGSVRRNGNVLSDVAPPLHLRMKTPHCLNRCQPLVLAVIRAPSVMHVDSINSPSKGESCEQIDELFERKLMKRFWHNGPPCRLMPAICWIVFLKNRLPCGSRKQFRTEYAAAIGGKNWRNG